METPPSLVSGWSGGLPGKGRPSAALSSTSGRLFAQEVERAREEREGSGLAQRRRAEVDDARRSTRHAGFGAERPSEHEPRAARAEPAEHGGAAPTNFAPAAATPRVDAPAPPERASVMPAAGTTAETAARTPAAPVDGGPPIALAAQDPAAVPLVAAKQVPVAGVTAAAVERAVAPALESASQLPLATRTSAARSTTPSAPPPEAGLATAARADEILHQLELHLTPGVKRLTLELEPLELGRIAVQLALRAGKLSAIVRGERPETLALLQGRAEELTRLLSERGLAADELRFELGFRSAARDARHGAEARSASSRPRPARADSASFDTYA